MIVLTNFKWFFILLGIAVICAILVITYKLDTLSSTSKVKKTKSKPHKTTEKVLIQDEELKESLTEDDLYEGLRDEYKSIDESVFDDRELNNYYKASEYSKGYDETENKNSFDDEYEQENNYFEEDDSEEESTDDETDMFNHLNMGLEDEEENIEKEDDSFDEEDMFNHLSIGNEEDTEEENDEDNSLDDFDMFNHLNMEDDFDENKSSKSASSFDQTMVFDNIREETNKKEDIEPVVEQMKNFVEPEESDFEFFTTTSKATKNKRINSNTENEIKPPVKNQTELESNDFLNEMEMTLMRNRENRRNRKSIVSSGNIKNESQNIQKEEIKKADSSKTTKKAVAESKTSTVAKKTTKKATTKKATDDKKSAK